MKSERLTRFRHDGRRLGAYLAIPALSAVTPILAIPAVTSQYGSDGWSAFAVGMSVGSGAAVLGELGWGLTGPQRVAGATAQSKVWIYHCSLATRALSCGLLMVPVLLMAAALSQRFHAAAAVTGVAYLCSALTPAWYFVGAGRPGVVLLIDTLPRVVGTALGALAVAVLGAPLLTLALTQVAAGLLPPVLGGFLVGGASWAQVKRHIRSAPRVVRIQSVALGGRAASAVYIALPTSIVALFSPGSVAVFSAVERLMRMCLAVLQAIPNSMQRWVGARVPSRVRVSRVIMAIKFNSVVGLVAGAGFVATIPLASRLLFSETIDVELNLAILGAAIIVATCISRSTGGLGLVALGRVGHLSSSAALGALVGLPTIALLSFLWGAQGGLAGALVAEVSVLLYQSVSVYLVIKRGKSIAQGLGPSF